jgi:hypothetical protein
MYRVARLVTALFLLSGPLFAFRGRPLAPLRFETTLSVAAVGAASDGNNFLVVWERIYGSLYGQVVRNGRPFGPSFFIGRGTKPSVAWNGSDYLVSWSAPIPDSGVFVTRVSSLSGNVESVQGPIVGGHSLQTRLTAGRQSVLLTAAPASDVIPNVIAAVALDRTGKPLGPPVAVSTYGFQPFAVTPTEFGFAIATSGYFNTSLMRVTHDGQPLGTTIIEGPYDGRNNPYSSGSIQTASDGTNIYVVFAAVTLCEVCPATAVLKSSVVGKDGELKVSPLTIAQGTLAQSIIPQGMIWNGSEAVVLLGSNQSQSSAVLMAVRPDGTFRTLSEVFPAPVAIMPSALAWNGRDFLAVAGTQGWIVSSDGRATSISLGAVPTEQLGAIVSSSATQYLAAWYENTSQAYIARATRIDRNGDFVDEELVLPSISPTAIASNGTDWLIVGRLGSVRIGADGSILDPTLGVTGEALAWGSRSYLVVSSQLDLVATLVSSDGSIRGRTPIASRESTSDSQVTFAFPGVVWDGSAFLVTYARVIFHFINGNPPSQTIDLKGEAVRVDSDGRLLSDPVSLPASVLVASDGAHDFLAWGGNGKAFAAIVPKDEIQTAANRVFQIAEDFVPMSVAFDGRDFLVVGTRPSGGSDSVILQVSVEGQVSAATAPPHDQLSISSPRALASNSTMPPLLVFFERLPEYGSINRVAAITKNDWTIVQSPPTPPSLVIVRPELDGVSVSWSAVPDVLGYEIDARLADGGYRVLGVAASNRTLARLSTFNLDIAAIVIRTWNSAGTSPPSADAQISYGRRRAVAR